MGPELALVSARKGASKSSGGLVWDIFPSCFTFAQGDLRREIMERWFLSQTTLLGLELPFGGSEMHMLLCMCTGVYGERGRRGENSQACLPSRHGYSISAHAVDFQDRIEN